MKESTGMVPRPFRPHPLALARYTADRAERLGEMEAVPPWLRPHISDYPYFFGPRVGIKRLPVVFTACEFVALFAFVGGAIASVLIDASRLFAVSTVLISGATFMVYLLIKDFGPRGYYRCRRCHRGLLLSDSCHVFLDGQIIEFCSRCAETLVPAILAGCDDLCNPFEATRAIRAVLNRS